MNISSIHGKNRQEKQLMLYSMSFLKSQVGTAECGVEEGKVIARKACTQVHQSRNLKISNSKEGRSVTQ